VFQSEADERAFWEAHDTAEYVDWSRARPAAFPELHPSTETISHRLPAGLLAELKSLANRKDVPYQSLMKVFLADRVARERAGNGSTAAAPKRRTPAVRSNQPGHAKPARSKNAARG
jgi:predicted DNA binding CopG/RHH family protein